MSLTVAELNNKLKRKIAELIKHKMLWTELQGKITLQKNEFDCLKWEICQEDIELKWDYDSLNAARQTIQQEIFNLQTSKDDWESDLRTVYETTAREVIGHIQQNPQNEILPQTDRYLHTSLARLNNIKSRETIEYLNDYSAELESKKRLLERNKSLKKALKGREYKLDLAKDRLIGLAYNLGKLKELCQEITIICTELSTEIKTLVGELKIVKDRMIGASKEAGRAAAVTGIGIHGREEAKSYLMSVRSLRGSLNSASSLSPSPSLSPSSKIPSPNLSPNSKSSSSSSGSTSSSLSDVDTSIKRYLGM